MTKKILLIENESAFAAGVSESLEASGFDVRVTGDGKEGLELAREWAPDAIVLCVELPGMSGYLVCQKLKKDEALKGIPLVLTSAEATEETFDKHRTLKARADEYLIKPYPPGALLDKLAALVGLPEPAETTGDLTGEHEELVSLEEEMGLEALPSEPEAELPALDLEALPDEPAPGGSSTLPGDEDLSLLDDAFEGLAAGTGPGFPRDAARALDEELSRDEPVAVEDVDAAAASIPLDDDAPARADLGGGLGLDDADAALGALGADDPFAETLDDDAPAPPAPPIRGASADALRAAGIPLLTDPPAPAAAPPGRGEAAAAPAAVARLERELAEARAALAARDGELAGLRSRLDAAAGRLDEAGAELGTAREELRVAESRAGTAEGRAVAAERRADELERRAERAEARAADAERKAEEAAAAAEEARDEARRKADEAALAADAAGKVEALEREVDELRTELVVARGEADGARGEVDRRTAELRKRVSELELANAKHEERVLKAYQKIKNDEKVREKVRKAIQIAGQLLEDGLPAEPPAEKERRSAAAALLGRDS